MNKFEWYSKNVILEFHFLPCRFSTITMWVSSMIIAAGDVYDRVEIINIFIGIAHALYSCLGNLNGFMAVMEGLELAQVRKSISCSQRQYLQR